MFKKLRNMFKKKEEHVQLSERFKKKQSKPMAHCPCIDPIDNNCRHCRMVKSAGRSGEHPAYFVDGSSASIEIINERNVPGRGVYTINICNSEKVGWCDAPIFYCPYCGKRLGEE